MSDAPSRLSAWTDDKILEVTADSGLKIENILVEGRRHTDPDTIKAIANVEKGDPLLSFDPQKARAMIEKISWVRSARVERRYPDTIYIQLEERVPMALWQRQKRLSLIDTEGVVLTDHRLDRFKDYIILVGDAVPEKSSEFISLLSAEPMLWDKIEAAKLVSGRRWDLVLKNGVVVKLPEGEIALAFKRLVVLQEEEKLMDKNLTVIDIRDTERITVRTKPGTVHEYKAGYSATSGEDGVI